MQRKILPRLTNFDLYNSLDKNLPNRQLQIYITHYIVPHVISQHHHFR